MLGFTGVGSGVFDAFASSFEVGFGVGSSAFNGFFGCVGGFFRASGEAESRNGDGRSQNDLAHNNIPFQMWPSRDWGAAGTKPPSHGGF